MSGTTGTSGSDNLNGGSGADIIDGGAGADKISGGSGSDTVDGGSGSDVVNGDSGNDTLIYNLGENLNGSKDVYTGGSGIDVVRVMLTDAEWQSAPVQYQLGRYFQHLQTVRTNANTGEVSNGSASDFTFDFGSGTTLTVQMMERLEVFVDGSQVTNLDRPIFGAGVVTGGVVEDADTTPSPTDSLSASGSITFFNLDFTDNHNVAVAAPSGALGVLSASITNAAFGDGSGTVSWTYNFNNSAAQYLSAGQTRIETHTVRITDETTQQATTNAW